ncbi:MAG: hypothetical protein KDE24_23995 [Caldilinea sp.]|nr:hypothetical protein [Caldilinea sp.]
MSARKQTPDVLGDILGGATAADAAAIDMVGVEPAKPAPAARKPRTPRTKTAKAAAAAPAPVAPPPVQVEWEYREVVFRDYRGWRVRSVNGRELSNWKGSTSLTDYLAQAGAEGWEMVSITDPRHNEKTAYFKRIKLAP